MSKKNNTNPDQVQKQFWKDVYVWLADLSKRDRAHIRELSDRIDKLNAATAKKVKFR